MLASLFISRGLKRDIVLQCCGITRHKYYHRSKGKPKGAKPSETTVKFTEHGEKIVSNAVVIEAIRLAFKNPWLDYGYQKMTWHLKLQGFIINQKKVYRLFKENCLLKPRHEHKPRTYVKYRIVTPTCPLQLLEMDIKYIWMERERRYGYLLTILDVFTRTALSWYLGYTVTRYEVKKLWEHVITHFLQAADMLAKGISIEIRNDNGSQFIATLIQEFFRENHLNQVFTHPYTPQENGHIESFHSILDRALLGKQFYNLEDAQKAIVSFYDFYNNERIHTSTANLPPVWFWELWEKDLVERRKIKAGIKYKLKISHQQLSGFRSLREVLCLKQDALDGYLVLKNREEVIETPYPEPSVFQSPSVVLC